jgi:D-psicose/D-tagatose/L-ribulose 3-epimerase
MRFGAHLFVWTAEVTPEAVAQAARGAAEAGLDFLEIPLLREDLPLAEVREVLGSHSLGATCSLGLPREARLPDYPEQAKTFLSRALKAAYALGSPVLTGVLYGTLGEAPEGPPGPEALEVVARVLREAAREARILGLSLGLEPVNRYETALVNTARQGLALLEAIGEPNVFLHLDTYHMNIEERGFREPILEAGARLGYIHLSESDRGTPGTGNVRWEEVFAGLAAIGYRGPLVMESFVAVSPEIARATCIWRPVAEDPQRLVREGLAFLRAQAEAVGLHAEGA